MRLRYINVADASESLTAARLAIQRAKSRGEAEVLPDDLLAGALLVVSRFGIVWIGETAIDLEAFDLVPMDLGGNSKEKVTYSTATAAIFDRAAGIARREAAARVGVVHLLAAFAPEMGGLMGELKSRYQLDDRAWRAGLSLWQHGAKDGSISGVPAQSLLPSALEFLSPEEAAEFLGLHIQTVRGYIRSGRLPALRVAGERAIRIRRDDLLALLEPLEPSGGDNNG